MTCLYIFPQTPSTFTDHEGSNHRWKATCDSVMGFSFISFGACVFEVQSVNTYYRNPAYQLRI